MSNPNNNCLEGKKCPKCGSYGPLCVTAVSVFEMHDDGSEEYSDVEYDENSPASCSCGFTGTWGDFDDPPSDKPKLKTYTVVGISETDHNRWADTVEAETPQGAEKAAHSLYREQNGDPATSDCDDLTIAAVIDGDRVKIVA